VTVAVGERQRLAGAYDAHPDLRLEVGGLARTSGMAARLGCARRAGRAAVFGWVWIASILCQAGSAPTLAANLAGSLGPALLACCCAPL